MQSSLHLGDIVPFRKLGRLFKLELTDWLSKVERFMISVLKLVLFLYTSSEWKLNFLNIIFISIKQVA